MDNKMFELTIDEMVEELEWMKWANGTISFKITKKSDNHNNIILVVKNLNIEYNESFIWASDDHDILINNTHIMPLILRSSLRSVIKSPSSEHFYVQLNLEDDIITIEDCEY